MLWKKKTEKKSYPEHATVEKKAKNLKNALKLKKNATNKKKTL